MAKLADVYQPELGEDIEFTPIPSGEYKAAIVGDEEKIAQSSGAKYLSVEFEIVEGDYKGRKVYTNLNLWHPSAMAKQIAQKELNSIAAAVGVTKLVDSNQLHNIPIFIKVKQRKYVDSQGEDAISNDIKGYRSLRSGQPAASPSGSTQNPQQPTTGAGSWMKKPQQ